jgi:hypothetical protein
MRFAIWCGVKRGASIHRSCKLSRGEKRAFCGVKQHESGLSRGEKRQTQLIGINYLATSAALNPTVDRLDTTSVGSRLLGMR